MSCILETPNSVNWLFSRYYNNSSIYQHTLPIFHPQCLEDCTSLVIFCFKYVRYNADDTWNLSEYVLSEIPHVSRIHYED
jgi:HD superfamily phosphohydrolase